MACQGGAACAASRGRLFGALLWGGDLSEMAGL